jgi:hypothetical protein
MPDDLNINSGADTDFGEAIILSTKFDDHTQIDIINNYPWAKDMSRDDLIIHLVETKMANLEEGEKAINNKKVHGCASWYDWRVKNWGTKWDILISDIEFNVESVSIIGDTAWTPPLAAFTTISEKFNLLHFYISYAEPGCGFQGVADIEDGTCDDFSEDYVDDYVDDYDGEDDE